MSGSADEHKGHSHNSSRLKSVDMRKLMLSLGITAAVMVLEIVGGVLTNSLALISDAGHMFTHCFAISLALGAMLISRRPPCHHHTYGLYRAEVLAALFNGIFLLLVVALILYESVQRIMHPRDVFGFEMLMVALIGLATNGASLYILRDTRRNDLNIRSVMYHLGADAASSVGIVGAAIVIIYTGWSVIDPLVSIFISALIIVWAVSILRESGKILLQVAPEGLNADMVSEDLKRKFPQIDGIYHVHLWTITSEMLVFSAHVTLSKKVKRPEKVISRMNEYLGEKYNIIESTIQVDSEMDPRTCKLDAPN